MARAGSPGRGSSDDGEAANRTGKPKRPERRPGPTGRVAAARDRIVRRMLSPLNVVLLPRRYIEEVLDDAVKRGRMTRSDAQEMIQTLLSRGARATDDFLADVERMLGSRTESIEDDAEPTDSDGRAGAAANLPIADYDALSAPQVQERLDGLTPAELRKLRDYEQRNANRKTVLDRIERHLR